MLCLVVFIFYLTLQLYMFSTFIVFSLYYIYFSFGTYGNLGHESIYIHNPIGKLQSNYEFYDFSSLKLNRKTIIQLSSRNRKETNNNCNFVNIVHFSTLRFKTSCCLVSKLLHKAVVTYNQTKN
jgi:hypothetical protein